jgi:hypothetical protein
VMTVHQGSGELAAQVFTVGPTQEAILLRARRSSEALVHLDGTHAERKAAARLVARGLLHPRRMWLAPVYMLTDAGRCATLVVLR